MNNKGQAFGFIKVIFIGIAFLLVFGALAGVVSGGIEMFVNQWGDTYPLLAWIMSGTNIWIFIGGVLAVIGGIVWGLNLTE